MPAVFFGHGTPMNALQRNRYTIAWGQFGNSTPRPRGIVRIGSLVHTGYGGDRDGKT
jgi:4,5-DOPA dioxygenase extradiol